MPAVMMPIADLEDYRADCKYYGAQKQFLDRLMYTYNQTRVSTIFSDKFTMDPVTTRAVKSGYYKDVINIKTKELLMLCGSPGQAGDYHRQMVVLKAQLAAVPGGRSNEAYFKIDQEITSLREKVELLNKQEQFDQYQSAVLESRYCREKGLQPGCSNR